jgi:hypothetical protein
VSWGRIDDGLHDHEKFLFFGPAATPREMWVFGMSWTHQHYRRFQAAGFVPTCMPSVWAGSRAKGLRFAAELVRSGLWEQADGGWVFHDWLDYAAPDERAHFGAEPGPPPRRQAPRDPGEPAKAEPDRQDLSEKRREAGRRGAATTNSKRWGSRQPSANRRQKSASAESANVGKRRQTVGKPEPVADTFADPSGRQTSANPNPVEVQKPPPPTPSVIDDLGGGGGESPVPQAQTPTPGGPGDLTAADAVLSDVAAAWDRPAAALVRHRDAVFSALMCGWRQDALARHLAADPPQPVFDAAGLLADRLNRLPESPDHCGRRCCAASAPAAPAVCITHHVPVAADGCEYCAVASGRCLRHPGSRVVSGTGECEVCFVKKFPDDERARYLCDEHETLRDHDGTCPRCPAEYATGNAS